MEVSDSAEQKTAPKPIIVVGANRSGTKWLSNILCNHSQIVGMQSQRARGILETNEFHRLRTKFDIRFADDYIGLLQIWQRTEFFQLTGESLEYLYQLSPRPKSILELFRLVMDRYAERQSARFWCQKTDPQTALEIAATLPDARYVLIRRDPVDVLESTHKMNQDVGISLSRMRAMVGIARHHMMLSRLQQQTDAVVLSYERLQESPASVTAQVCRDLGLSMEQGMERVSFSPNSSFANQPQLVKAAKASDYRQLKLIYKLATLMPLHMLNHLMSDRRRSSVPLQLVSGTFGPLKDSLADSRDYIS